MARKHEGHPELTESSCLEKYPTGLFHDPTFWVTEPAAIAPLPTATPVEEAQEEKIEVDERLTPSQVTPEPEYPEPMTEPTAISPLAPAAIGEEAQEEQIEMDERLTPSLVTPEPGYPELMTEPTAVSPVAPTAPGEEAQEEQIEGDERLTPSLVTPEPGYSEPMTEPMAVSPLAPTAPAEESQEEQIEVDERLTPSLVTPEPGYPEPMTEPTTVSPLAPAAPGEQAQEEQIEVDERLTPSMVTPEPGYPEPVLLEKEQEQIASAEVPWQTQRELFPAPEQEEQLRQQVEEPQENGQKIKAEPQAELPEAQSDTVDMKRKSKDDMGRIQEENLDQQRGDQQNQVSERMAGTPPMKHPLSCFFEKMKAQLNAELQTAQTRMTARQKRLEDEMKIIREKLHPLPQSLQKQEQVLASHRAACEDYQQLSGTEGPQIYISSFTKPAAAAAASSKGAFSPRAEKRSRGTLFTSRADPAAAQPQEVESDSLELLRKIVNKENPGMKYTKLEDIGRGTFGDVCRALDNATGGEVAIKKINLKGLRKKELKVNELMVVKINRNPNLINHLDSYLVGDELWLVIEYMDGGTLRDVISKTSLSEDQMAAISRECLQGLDFLHSKHVTYRDVKSCNILLRTNGSVKLADFGLFVQLTPEQSRQSSVAGTSGWLAPEVVTGQPCGPKTDIWSFGIVGIEMMEREVPCRDATPVSAQLLTARGERPQLRQPNRFSSCLCDFLSCCLQTDVKCRWSARELLKHPFVRSAKPASSLAPLINSIKKKKKKEEWRRRM
ncbi:uncharacterized protein GJ701_016904 [Geothlypis trichas]